MERRGNIRQPFLKEVIISCSDVGLIRGQTRDLSNSGVYVETGHISLNSRIKVDVSFLLKQGKNTIMQTIGARVARVDANGAGLQFDRPLEKSRLLV